jgi:hypothetical protein
MIRWLTIALVSLGLNAPVAAQQQSLGVFGLWGAFHERTRCYAISQVGPRVRQEAARAFASVSYWPGTGARGQVSFRFRWPKRRGSAVLLRIDDRTFQLIGGGANAWAADAAADAEIVAAMRTGVEMSVETRSAAGGLIRDAYQLRGAATAIDAAAIGCAR